MRRLASGVLPVLFFLLWPSAAFADDVPPYRTVVDAVVPPTQGLTITGSDGGCDLLLDNGTGQNVTFFDMAKPPKAYAYKAAPKGSPSSPLPVSLHVGAWPCLKLPAVSEDQQWNHQSVTVLIWSLKGQVGAVAFQLKAHTEYDPALDPSSEWMFYLRIGGGLLVVLGLVLTGPWLLGRRREILKRRSTPAGARP